MVATLVISVVVEVSPGFLYANRGLPEGSVVVENPISPPPGVGAEKYGETIFEGGWFAPSSLLDGVGDEMSPKNDLEGAA